MISARKVIFPGLFAGCIFLVFVTNMIANPQIALAFENPIPTPTAAAVQDGAAAVIADSAPAAESSTGSAEQPSSTDTQAGGCTISQAYPEAIRQWCELIERYAGQNSLDPNLVAAVMLQESGGNPQAYSKSGAVGLLQVMPRDGKASSFMCINGPCFSSRPTTDELYDPEFNISYGTKMLAGLIAKTGDLREALRAYGPINMGYRYADIILSIRDRYR